jgi:hypothetical protein
MSDRIELPALLGSHPLAALASFGLLRLVSAWDGSAKLGFSMQDDWVAFLQTEKFASADALIVWLQEWLQTTALDRVLDCFPGKDDVRVELSDYQKALSSALDANDELVSSFLNAFAADGAVDRSKGQIKPSAFYMLSGQQTFLKGVKEIVEDLRKNPETLLREALCGPWVYQTKRHGLGWDPNTERLYALRHKAPTAEKATCIAGAVILALWALPLYPAVSYQGRPYTLGFVRDKVGLQFSWPVFSTPISLETLKSLVQVGEKGWISRDKELRGGIEAYYRSRRFEFGQGYAVLRAPQLIQQRRSARAGSAF